MATDPITFRRQLASAELPEATAMKRPGLGRPAGQRHRCGVCRRHDCVASANNWCAVCAHQFALWQRCWDSLGRYPRCPARLLEYHLALYQWRAEQGLPLFEDSQS